MSELLSTMMNDSCPRDYPVDLERARKAFAAAVAELAEAQAKHSAFLAENDKATWAQYDPTFLWSRNRGMCALLENEFYRFQALHRLALGVLELRLTSADVQALIRAENGGFLDNWDKAVAEMKKNPPGPPYVAPPLIVPCSFIKMADVPWWRFWA